MKKTILMLLVLFSLQISLDSCVQNGGHIGTIFGRWCLVEIEAENEQPPVLRGDVFWAFQSDVIQMQRDNGYHSFSVTYGVFRIDGEMLYLDFPEENLPPFEETGLQRECELQILKMTHKEMVLKYHTGQDSSLIYYLRKW